MQLKSIALAAALLAGPAAAQETKSQEQGAQQKSEAKQQEQKPEKAQGAKGADTQASQPEDIKGYGYGTPSGVEAESEARQAADEKRKPPKTPQQEEAASVTEPHARAEQATLSGKVVSTGKDRLTIQAPDGMRDIQVTSKTEVRGNGRQSVKQLKRGDEVRVSFDTKQGVSVAKRIEVRSASTTRGGQGVEVTPPPGSATPPGSTTAPGSSATPSGTPEAGKATQGGTAAPGERR